MATVPSSPGTNCIKAVFNGVLQGIQPFSFSLWQDWHDTVPTQTAVDVLVTTGSNFHTAALALEANLKNYLQATSHFSNVTVYAYTAANELVAQAVQPLLGTAGSGTGGQAPQIALVVTTLTPRFGRSFHGRMYLPMEGLGTVGGQATLANTTAIATAVGGFINSSGEAGDFDWSVPSFSKQLMTPITNVRVDSVFDTQRRRRDQLTSSHTFALATPQGS